MTLRAALCIPFLALGVYGQPTFEVASVTYDIKRYQLLTPPSMD
jgi:hypothetical protein